MITNTRYNTDWDSISHEEMRKLAQEHEQHAEFMEFVDCCEEFQNDNPVMAKLHWCCIFFECESFEDLYKSISGL